MANTEKSMLVRRERTFYGVTREEAEAAAAPFVAKTNGKIYFNSPVLAPPIGKRNPKWQVDVEYFEAEDDKKELCRSEG
jgi:hypothetical protein